MLKMTEKRFSPRGGVVARAALAALIGMIAGALFNAWLGEQGADTPAFSLLGGGLAVTVVIVAQTRRRARAARDG